MSRKALRSTRLSLACAIALGTSIGAVTHAGASAERAFCYDRTTKLVHVSPTGRCEARRQVLFVVGARGVRGAAGARGLSGFHGTDGAAGPQGLVGPQGPVGPAGGTGGTGPAGGAGGTGAVGGSGGTGPVGGTGGTGAPGVNVFHKVVSGSNTSASGTITATCPGSEIVTGGGFTADTLARVGSSAPNTAGTAWDVAYSNSNMTGVTAYAICVAGTYG